jgi:hypothetical protein
MLILFAIFGLVLGLGVAQVLLLIAHKVDSKIKACAYSCLIGMASFLVLWLVANWVFPIIGQTFIQQVSSTGTLV